MMYAAERPSREAVKTSTPLAPQEQLMALLGQPVEVRVRGLMNLCQHMSRQYQETHEACMERTWWRLLNQAGIYLREALDQARAAGYPGLSDQEAEQAYFLLIHVAYFFEPGGIAEALWPLLSSEPGNQRELLATSEALALTFGKPPMHVAEPARWYFKHWWQQLGQMLRRSVLHRGDVAALHELAVHGPPLQEVETAQPRSLVTRRHPDGAYPGG